MPSRVAAIQGMSECLTGRWTSVTRRPVLRSYQDRLSSSVAGPELYDQVAGQVLRLDFSPLLPPELDQGRFVIAHDDPGVRFCAGSSVNWQKLPLSHFQPLNVSRLSPEYWSPIIRQALRAAFEAAGVEFTNGDRPEVRLRQVHRKD